MPSRNVLVNGSLTEEINIWRGLKQGDHMLCGPSGMSFTTLGAIGFKVVLIIVFRATRLPLGVGAFRSGLL